MGSFLFRLARVLLVLGIAVALAFGLVLSRSKPEKKKVVQSTPRVKVIKARPRTEVMTLLAYGTVVPRNQVKIALEVAGRIDYVHPSFKEGGKIAKNDLVIRLDQRSFRLDRDGAQVRVAQAQADIKSLNQDISNLEKDIELAHRNMDLSRKELDRIRNLSKSQFASKTSLDKAEQLLLSAKIKLQTIENRLALTTSMMEGKKSALAMAGVNLQKASLALEKTEIRLAFDGLVLEKHAEAGEYVNPGQVIGLAYEQGALDVDVGIPLEQVRWIKEMFDQGLFPEAVLSIANLDLSYETLWKAKVARVKAGIDEQTRTLPLTLEIEPIPMNQIPHLYGLKPGTFVKCRILGTAHENIFALPRHLVKPDGSVLLAVDNRLEMRKVSVLRKFEENVYIDSGLSPGELIIVSPLPNALEGMELVTETIGNQP